MKQYPHMHYFNKGIIGEYIYAFDKLDGSNIRAEWNPKRGFYKFGSRNSMIDEKSPHLGEAVVLFKKKYANDFSPKTYSKSSGLVFKKYFIVSTLSWLNLPLKITGRQSTFNNLEYSSNSSVE